MQGFEAGKGRDGEQVLCQMEKLGVGGPRDMSALEGANDQPILPIEHIIAPQIIEHDGVVLIVVVWEPSPEHWQGLAIEHSACSGKTGLSRS